MLFYPGGFSMTAVWLVAMIVLLIIEGIVPGLVSIWFAIGAFAAMISAILGAPLWLQVLWFFAVSILTLCLTRPFAKKYVNSRAMPTNADMLIGKECARWSSVGSRASQCPRHRRCDRRRQGVDSPHRGARRQGRDRQGHDRCENRGRQAHSKVKIFYY